jgi:hypothetical protein
MDFNQYAAACGIQPSSAWIDIIDTAIEYLNIGAPCPDGDEDRWYHWANREADRLATKYAEAV